MCNNHVTLSTLPNRIPQPEEDHSAGHAVELGLEAVEVAMDLAEVFELAPAAGFGAGLFAVLPPAVLAGTALYGVWDVIVNSKTEAALDAAFPDGPNSSRAYAAGWGLALAGLDDPATVAQARTQLRAEGGGSRNELDLFNLALRRAQGYRRESRVSYDDAAERYQEIMRDVGDGQQSVIDGWPPQSRGEVFEAGRREMQGRLEQMTPAEVNRLRQSGRALKAGGVIAAVRGRVDERRLLADSAYRSGVHAVQRLRDAGGEGVEAMYERAVRLSSVPHATDQCPTRM